MGTHREGCYPDWFAIEMLGVTGFKPEAQVSGSNPDRPFGEVTPPLPARVVRRGAVADGLRDSMFTLYPCAVLKILSPSKRSILWFRRSAMVIEAHTTKLLSSSHIPYSV